MEFVRIIVWPAAILLFIWTVLLLFRKEIRELLGRTKDFKAGTGGFEFSAAGIASQAEAKPPEIGLGEALTVTHNLQGPHTELTPEQAKRLEEIRTINVVPIVKEQESLIRAEIEQLKISPEELPNILISQLARFQIEQRFETAYRIIFGTQIQILKNLNLYGATSRTQLLAVYEEATNNYPSFYSSYPFEQYIMFLTGSSLIIEVGTDQFSITIAGKEFLKWMVENGVTDAKSF
jgi:hypothetical protein